MIKRTMIKEIVSELGVALKAETVALAYTDMHLSRQAIQYGMDKAYLLDEIAAELSRGFLAGEYSFDFCSGMTSSLIGSCIDECSTFVWDVFTAFDAGEICFDIPSGSDPVEAKTRPMLQAIRKA